MNTFTHKSVNRNRSMLMALAVALLVGTPLGAQTWTGAGGDNNASTTGNWTPSRPAASNENIVFSGTTQTNVNNDWFTGWSSLNQNGITFAADAGSFTLGGNAVNMARNMSIQTPNKQTLAWNMNYTTARSITASGGTSGNPLSASLDITGDLSGQRITVNAANDNYLVVTPSGTNTHAGWTAGGRGQLNILDADVLGTGSLELGINGVFDNVSGGSLAVSNDLRLISANNAAFFLGSAPMTFPKLIMASGTTASSQRLLDVGGSGDTGVLTVGHIEAETPVNAFRKVGTGTLVILDAASENVFTAEFRLNDGRLVLGHHQAMGTGTFAVVGGQVEALSDFTGAQSLTNDITHSAGLTVGGEHAITVAGSFKCTSGNSATLANNLPAGKTFAILGVTEITGGSNNRTLTFTGTGDTVLEGTVSNGAAIGSIAVDTNGGRVTLNGDNSFTGSTTITGGTLVVGHANALGPSGAITVDGGGTFAVGSGVTFIRAVTFNAGSGLAGGGTLVRGGAWSLPATFTLAPGFSTGILTIDLAGNTLTMNGTTTTEIEIAGLNDHDILHILGAAALAGDLDIVLLDGYLPAFGTTFGVITATGGLSGEINLTGAYASWFTAAIVDGNTLQLTSLIPEPTSALLLALAGMTTLRRRRR